jgi:hypothetical protein
MSNPAAFKQQFSFFLEKEILIGGRHFQLFPVVEDNTWR